MRTQLREIYCLVFLSIFSYAICLQATETPQSQTSGSDASDPKTTSSTETGGQDGQPSLTTQMFSTEGTTTEAVVNNVTQTVQQMLSEGRHSEVSDFFQGLQGRAHQSIQQQVADALRDGGELSEKNNQWVTQNL